MTASTGLTTKREKFAQELASWLHDHPTEPAKANACE